jgi:hypothetical protein
MYKRTLFDYVINHYSKENKMSAHNISVVLEYASKKQPTIEQLTTAITNLRAGSAAAMIEYYKLGAAKHFHHAYTRRGTDESSVASKFAYEILNTPKLCSPSDARVADIWNPLIMNIFHWGEQSKKGGFDEFALSQVLTDRVTEVYFLMTATGHFTPKQWIHSYYQGYSIIACPYVIPTSFDDVTEGSISEIFYHDVDHETRIPPRDVNHFTFLIYKKMFGWEGTPPEASYIPFRKYFVTTIFFVYHELANITDISPDFYKYPHTFLARLLDESLLTEAIPLLPVLDYRFDILSIIAHQGDQEGKEVITQDTVERYVRMISKNRNDSPVENVLDETSFLINDERELFFLIAKGVFLLNYIQGKNIPPSTTDVLAAAALLNDAAADSAAEAVEHTASTDAAAAAVVAVINTAALNSDTTTTTTATSNTAGVKRKDMKARLLLSSDNITRFI